MDTVPVDKKSVVTDIRVNSATDFWLKTDSQVKFQTNYNTTSDYETHFNSGIEFEPGETIKTYAGAGIFVNLSGYFVDI